MRINRSLLNWGVFLIALGGIPLAVEQGWIDVDLAGDLGRLWPLILVGIGLGLILRWTPIAWFGGALVAATFGIIFGAALVALPEDDIGNLQGVIPAIATGACVSGDAGPASTSADGVANPAAFELELALSCGELRVSRAATASWSLEAAHATDAAPRVEDVDRDGATAVLRLSQDSREDFVFFGERARSAWGVEVPSSAALTVAATLNAVRGEVELGEGPLQRVSGTLNASDVVLDAALASTPERASIDLTLNASDATLRLPAGSIGVTVTLNASSLSVCVPAAAALRVELAETLSSHDLARSGLQQQGTAEWSTPGFSSSAGHVLLSVSSTASDVSLERPETCA